MIWGIPKIWQDSECFILGGGASIIEQFNIPQEIVSEVRAGTKPLSAYSPYMEAIHHKRVIGVNTSFMIGTWIDMLFFGDRGFYLPREKQILNFPRPRISCHEAFLKHPVIKYVAKDNNHSKGLTTKPDHISWNTNSGTAAINLAMHLGARRIILLGFDMDMVDGNKHWHNEYKNNHKPPRNRSPKQDVVFGRHLSNFPFVAKDAQRLGLEIINASLNSKIPQFPKVSLKEIL